MTKVKSNTDAIKNRLISFVLPVYNEQDSLQELHQKITKAMKNELNDYELIFVNDGSTDNSFDILREIRRKDKRIRIIQFRKNFGKSAAYSAGFHNARGEIIITLDADLQNEPSEIPLFIDKINEGYDMVVGWRYKRNDSLDKTFFSKIFNRVVSFVTRLPLHDFNCPFKAYRREVLQEIEIYGELHRYIPVLAAAKGFSLTEIKIRNLPRLYGKSKYGMERYQRGMLDLLTVIFITRFAKRPLHLLGVGGIIVCVLGLSILLFLILAHFFYNLGILTDSGWNFHDRPAMILGILLMIVGTQFFSIGLLGELFIAGTFSRPMDEGYSIVEILENELDDGSSK